MSSLAALLDSTLPAVHHYTAESWNVTAEKAISKLSDEEEAPFSILYPASKILAERVVFEFDESVTPAFRLMTVVPAMVIGPPVIFPEGVEELNGTIKPIWEVLSGECRGLPRQVGSGMFVDVRDLVDVCWGLVEMKGEGKRVIVVGGRAEMKVMARVLSGRYPERLGHLKALLGGDVEVEDTGLTFDTEEAEIVLGRPWTSYEKSVSDTAAVLERYLS